MTADEQRLIAELTKHPAWQVLQKVVDERIDNRFKFLTSQILAGEIPTAEAIHYERGYFAGMRFLLKRPQAEEREILAALAKRGSEG